MPKVAEFIDDNEGLGLPNPPLICSLINRFINLISIFAHLAILLLIGVIVLNVVLRYVIGQSSVAIEELQWHLFAFNFMIGIAYCLVHDQHVRVDIFSSHWSHGRRAWVDLLAMVILVCPFAAMIFYDSISFVEFSIRLKEVSRNAGGLGARWIIKSVIPLSMALIFLAALSRAISMVFIIIKKK